MLDVFDRALMLIQQGNAANQRQVLHVVTPGPGFVRKKGQLVSKRIDHGHGFDQPLGVLVQASNRLFSSIGQQAVEGLFFYVGLHEWLRFVRGFR